MNTLRTTESRWAQSKALRIPGHVVDTVGLDKLSGFCKELCAQTNPGCPFALLSLKKALKRDPNTNLPNGTSPRDLSRVTEAMLVACTSQVLLGNRALQPLSAEDMSIVQLVEPPDLDL